MNAISSCIYLVSGYCNQDVFIINLDKVKNMDDFFRMIFSINTIRFFNHNQYYQDL